MKNAIQSTSELRDFVSVQMQRLANGDQGVNEAKAVCNYAGQVYNTLSLELKKAVAEKKYTGLAMKSIKFPSESK